MGLLLILAYVRGDRDKVVDGVSLLVHSNFEEIVTRSQTPVEFHTFAEGIIKDV